MGQVYLAEDLTLSRKIALKLLPADFTRNRDRVRRFQREARAASALNHPNIITIYEIGHVDDRHFISTEFIDGDTLRPRIKSPQTQADSAASRALVTNLQLREILNIATQTAEALAAAHEAGIVHRDIKPENVMVRRRDGYVKVLDFGLAKLTESPAVTSDPEAPTEAQTRAGVVLGTMNYISPEQARGEKVDARTDIWSLGVVLYEMITGRLPFEGRTPADVIASILTTEPSAVAQFAPDSPPELERIVGKALKKDREHRYQTSEELLADLRAAEQVLKLQIESSQATAKLSSPLSVARVRIVWPRLTLLVLVATLATAAGWWFISRSPRSDESHSLSSLRFAELYSWKSERGEATLDARFSHDGTQFAFTALNKGWETIWVRPTMNGAEPIPITQDKADNSWPIWSPDDQQIAFVSSREGETGIWSVPVLGGTPKRLQTVNCWRTRYWSKDGRTIYYESGNNLYSLDVASKTTTQITDLPTLRLPYRHFSISPDEEKIAYVDSKDGQIDIWVTSMRGRDTIRITNDAAEDRYPIWHPDGKRIIYTSNRGGAYQLCIAYIDGQKPVQVTVGGADHVTSDVSNDGTRVLDLASRDDSNVFSVDVDSGKELEMTSGIGLKLWPSVSPDGKMIAYQATNAIGKLVSSSIMLRSTSDGQQWQVASDGFNVSWSHDARQLAFLRFREGNVNIFSVGVAREDEKQLTTGGIVSSGHSLLPSNRVGQDVSWSPDGSKIAYCSLKSGYPNVWTINADGSHETQITANTDANLSLSSPLWSTDGKSIAYVSKLSLPRNGREVWNIWLAEQGRSEIILQSDSFARLVGWSDLGDELIVAIDKEHSGDLGSLMTVVLLAVSPGGGRRVIASLKSTYIATIQLSPDRRTAAFVSGQDGVDNIWLIPVAGGEARKITANADTKLFLSSPDWSPDGRTIYYSKQANSETISMIDNFK
jgi:eukaryotic-like serine/threonine-protein kinase